MQPQIQKAPTRGLLALQNALLQPQRKVKRLPAASNASIVITTRNRASYLDLTLAALEQQTVSTAQWEVIVMDDASADATATVLENYRRRKRLCLTAQPIPSPCGRGHARNLALQRAQGETVIFLEDNHLLAPDGLCRHLLQQNAVPCLMLGDGHRRILTHLFSPADFAFSGVSPSPVLAAEALHDWECLMPLTYSGEEDYRALFTYLQSAYQSIPHPWAYVQGSFSAPRAAIMVAGGFDERLDGWGLGDTELAYRLYQQGLVFHYDPKAITLCQLHPPKEAHIDDLRRKVGYFFAKHSRLSQIERQTLLRSKYPALN